MRLASLLAALSIVLAGAAARADGLDRDTILTDAPATPNKGTVRFSATGQGQSADSSNQSGITGNVLWAPLNNVAGDVGLYYTAGVADPTISHANPVARIRFQALRQSEVGIDLAAGLRYKSVGFSPDSSEFEIFLAGGRRFGSFELMINSVLGFELKGPGRDFEFKGFAGYRFTDAVRAGLDGRLQAEFIDESGTKTPQATDMDIVAGPAVSWLLLQDRLQLQALVGAAKPKGNVTYALGGFLYASYDF